LLKAGLNRLDAEAVADINKIVGDLESKVKNLENILKK